MKQGSMFKHVCYLFFIGLMSITPVYAQAIDEYTKLLILSDTYNGDTNFEDTSQNNHPITSFGNIHHTISDKAIGNSSISFDGSGDYLTIPANSDWSFGIADFTIDFYILVNPGNEGGVITSNIDTGLDWRHLGGKWMIFATAAENMMKFYYSTGTHTHQPINLPGINAGTWYHVAFVRSGDILYLFRDGILVNTANLPTSFAFDSYMLGVGNQGPYGLATNDWFFSGKIDQVRISKGIARWTSDFTPPTTPYNGPSSGGGIMTTSLAQIGNKTPQSVSESNPISILFETEEFGATLFSMDNNGLTVNEAGIYEISYSLSYVSLDSGADARRNARSYVYKNGNPANKIQPSIAYGYARGDTNSSDAPITTANVSFFAKLEAGDSIHLYLEAVGDWVSGTAQTIADECWMKIKLVE